MADNKNIDITKLPIVTQKAPYKTEVKKDERYSWCSCGLTTKDAFCDGTHKETGFKSVKYFPTQDETVYFCGCRNTKNPPFCDGSHSKL